RLPRLDSLGRRRSVGDGRRVVLVRESREVVTELMNEDVIRERIVDCNCAVQIEDAPAAVRAAVRENLDEFVRRELRDIPEPLVVERENVSFRSKSVIGRERIAIDSSRWPGDSGLRSRRTQSPDIEIRSMLLEW